MLGGESELANWSSSLEAFIFKTKRFPKDIAELAAYTHRPVPRAPAGTMIKLDQQNNRVVLVKTK